MNEGFNIDCSDDELSNCRGPWEGPTEHTYKIYSILAKNEVPDLHWKCPGYRAPSPDVEGKDVQEDNMNETKQEEDKSDFDFLDEVTLPKLKIRKDGEDALKGSAKKKTTSLDSIISNMRRHKMLPSQAKNP